MALKINGGGLVIAGTGFVLTRFTVTLALYEDPVRFYLAGVVPLLLGLGLAAFGVALAVADVDRSVAGTTARWCLVGAATMLVLVVLTLLGSAGGELPNVDTIRAQAYLSNFLIGGAVGGTLTGLYAARADRQRAVSRRHANRLQVLNRLLRHEVLNAVSVIHAQRSTENADRNRARAVIDEQLESIEGTIEEVRGLARATPQSDVGGTVVDLADCLERSAATVADRYPEASVDVDPGWDELPVHGTAQLEQAIAALIENAVAHVDDGSPDVELTTTPTTASVTVHDDGAGLPPAQQRLLEDGEISEFDDPRVGFGLNVVRLVGEDCGATIDTDVGEGGTAITFELERATRTDGEDGRPHPAVDGVRPALPQLLVTLVAALLAGVGYGVASELLGGSIAGIGVFYGTPSPVVGWIAHEFHSVVFGFVFAGLVATAPADWRARPSTHVAIGVAWALVLWSVAAGVIAPVWLRLLGIPAPLPNLTADLLVPHLVWGSSLGLFSAWGYARLPTRPVEWAVDRITTNAA